jgi:hypothetical protein
MDRYNREGSPPAATMPKTASKSPPPPAKQVVGRDQCKVQLLTTMCALKDEILRASDEKLRALKWATLNDFGSDAQKLEALLGQLEERVTGWSGDAPEGTSIVAPLVNKRGDAVAAQFRTERVDASSFVDGLAIVLPEFRRDFLAAVARNFGETVDVAAFLAACTRVDGAAQAAVVEPEAEAATPDATTAAPVEAAAPAPVEAVAPAPAEDAAVPAPAEDAPAAPEPEPAPTTPSAATPKPSLMSRMSPAFGSAKKKEKDADAEVEDEVEEVVADEVEEVAVAA